MAFYPRGSALVPYGTPLHVTELLLQVLKKTFQEFPEGYPFRYDPDDMEKTGVVFDVALNKESNIYGKKPLIVVSRGMQSTSPIMVGDLAAVHLPTNLKHGSSLVQASAIVQVVSRAKAEVEIVAQHVFGLLMLCRTHLPRLCNLHMAQAVSLSEVSKYEEDDTMFLGQLTLQYVSQYIWRQEEVAPVLQAVGVVTLGHAGNPSVVLGN